MTDFNPNRYSTITLKNPREILMLRGSGCQWRRCRFCDYHLDSSGDISANFALNSQEIDKVTGVYQKLEVINSGSFIDLDEATMLALEAVCVAKAITEIHFECHWMHREAIASLRKRFAKYGVLVQVKIGVETFDYLFRESYLEKGLDCQSPSDIARYFDEVCLLQGLPGQSVGSMLEDIAIGLTHFKRVCVNIMQANNMPIKPSPLVIADFIKHIYPIYRDNPRVDILLANTDFGVGGEIAL